MKNKELTLRGNSPVNKVSGKLFKDIRGLIDSAKSHVARTVNSTLVMLYWHIGDRIRKDILRKERAGYGGTDCLDAVKTIST